MKHLNTLAKAAIETVPTEDDQYVAMAAKEIAQDLSTGSERAKAAKQPQEVADIPPQVAKAIEDEVDDLDVEVVPMIKRAPKKTVQSSGEQEPTAFEELMGLSLIHISEPTRPY